MYYVVNFVGKMSAVLSVLSKSWNAVQLPKNNHQTFLYKILIAFEKERARVANFMKYFDSNIF
jgi:hypothetical protein